MNRRNHLPSQQDATLYQPHIVGYMSVDGSRNYCPDISQLKFVTNIPRGNVNWDLNHNIDQAVKKTTDNQEEKLNVLLKYLYHERNKFNLPPKTFITNRSTLISVMYSAFNIMKPVCIRATLFKNHIYMKKNQSETEKLERETRSDFQKKCSAWGYKFEQYMSSDEPNLAPDINKPVVENEEFSLVYCSQIGDHKLFYGAHTDGALANSNTANKPNTTDAQEIIQYLKSLEYLELKTNKEICHPKQDRNFRRYKLLRCWCQCYLGNYMGLLVGFRDDSGVVRRLQWFDTAQIAQYCKPLRLLYGRQSFGTFYQKLFPATYNPEVFKSIVNRYLLDEPNLAPDINKPVVENEEFSLVYSSQIGDHKLLYVAHTDGALANSNTANKPNTTDAQEIIQYLKSLEYLELKTNKEICHPKQDRNLRRHKLLHCWCQCYLGNYKGLLVGFRDDSGVVRRLQWFDTAQIAQYCKKQWDPQTILNFLNRFLTCVKNYFETTDYDSNSNIPLTVDFFIDPEPNSDFKAVVNENESILQDWYVEALNEEV